MNGATCMLSPSDDETTCQAIERAYQAHKPGPSKDFTRADAQRVALIHLLITQIDADTEQYKTAVRNTLTNKDAEYTNALIAFIDDTLSDRYKLVCSSLHALIAQCSSKPHTPWRALLGSRFTGVCAAGACRSCLTSPPRAFSVSGALPATLMLMAAFRSRSMLSPQASQT